MIILHSLYLYVSFKLENFLNVTMSGGRGICLIYNKFRNKLCLKKRVSKGKSNKYILFAKYLVYRNMQIHIYHEMWITFLSFKGYNSYRLFNFMR